MYFYFINVRHTKNCTLIMKTLLIYQNLAYDYPCQFVPQLGDTIFLTNEISGCKFFSVISRLIDTDQNIISLTIERI